MKKKLLALQVFLLCAINNASSQDQNQAQVQTEHYIGLAVSNVVGPSYALRHNRWSVVADAGWLTGFSGVYASVGGMYELSSMNRVLKFFRLENRQNGTDMLMSMGFGLFGQDYYCPSIRQRKWADKLSYVTPLGCNALFEFYFREKKLPDWNFAFRFRGPVYFTTREYKDVLSKGAVAMMLGTYQIVVQRRL
ncbi:MAG: hypothetical protein LBJ57_08025 [Prevotellaceae bacterium]|jgi:hypothetical protein|nr:hypothetical protein [Prevotellaceae bacterium]